MKRPVLGSRIGIIFLPIIFLWVIFLCVFFLWVILPDILPPRHFAAHVHGGFGGHRFGRGVSDNAQRSKNGQKGQNEKFFHDVSGR